MDGEQTGPPTPLVDASRSRVRTTKLLDQVFEKMWGDHGSVGLSVVLLQLIVSSKGRPQTVHEVLVNTTCITSLDLKIELKESRWPQPTEPGCWPSSCLLQFPIATPSSVAVSLSVKKRLTVLYNILHRRYQNV